MDEFGLSLEITLYFSVKKINNIYKQRFTNTKEILKNCTIIINFNQHISATPILIGDVLGSIPKTILLKTQYHTNMKFECASLNPHNWSLGSGRALWLRVQSIALHILCELDQNLWCYVICKVQNTSPYKIIEEICLK